MRKIRNKQKYLVHKTIDLYREVEANSIKEAEALAEDIGDTDATAKETRWIAQRITNLQYKGDKGGR